MRQAFGFKKTFPAVHPSATSRAKGFSAAEEFYVFDAACSLVFFAQDSKAGGGVGLDPQSLESFVGGSQSSFGGPWL